jgi:hypothetical protein
MCKFKGSHVLGESVKPERGCTAVRRDSQEGDICVRPGSPTATQSLVEDMIGWVCHPCPPSTVDVWVIEEWFHEQFQKGDSRAEGRRSLNGRRRLGEARSVLPRGDQGRGLGAYSLPLVAGGRRDAPIRCNVFHHA